MRWASVAAIVCSAALLWSGEEIRISLCDFERLKPAALAAAKEQTEFLFRSAGVSIDWNGCDEQRAAQDSGAFLVRLRADAVPERTKLATFGVLGGALLGGPHRGWKAEAYWRAIERTAAWQQINAAKLLGIVIAHEIGHLILGEHHSRGGVMGDAWDRRAVGEVCRGWLTFTKTDLERIRGELRRVEHRARRLKG